MSNAVAALEAGLRTTIRIQDQWWVLVARVILVGAIESQERWFLNFVHVFAGILWTGTDIFMGPPMAGRIWLRGRGKEVVPSRRL